MPLGGLDFSFAAINGSGDSKLIIKKMRNIDLYLNANTYPIIDEIIIENENDWEIYNTNIFLQDAPILPEPSNISPACDGWDNKICGLYFKLEGEGTKFAIPDLIMKSLEIPENISISIYENNVEISWDIVDGATSYEVYASDNPYTDFEEITSGSFYQEDDRIYWTDTILGNKKFFYVRTIKY